jgi:uncharacterized protein YukE
LSEQTEIIVTPERLRQSAENMEALIQRILAGYREIEHLAEGNQSSFMGKCADSMLRKMKSMSEKGKTHTEKLGSFPVRLGRIADEYADAERENRNVTDRN